MKKVLLSFALLLIVFCFTGCVTILSSDTVVNLDKSENWEINQNILFEGTSFSDYGQSVTDGLDTLVAEGKNSGLDVTYKKLADKDGNVPYLITIKGMGLDKLNETLGLSENVLPAFNKVTVNGETAYGFQMDASSLSSGGLDLGYASEFKFTIEGMKVLETNGQKSGSSVTWENPSTTMTATLLPVTSSSGSGIAWWVILIIVIGVLGIALVILLIAGVFKKKEPQPQYYYPSGYGTQAPPPSPTGMSTPPPMQPTPPMPLQAVPPSYQAPPVPQAPQTPPLPQVPLPPPASGAMPTVISPRGVAPEEPSGEATIMMQPAARKTTTPPEGAEEPPQETKT